jgi:hypothetical protein
VALAITLAVLEVEEAIHQEQPVEADRQPS